jgi:hypothetical protein
MPRVPRKAEPVEHMFAIGAGWTSLSSRRLRTPRPGRRRQAADEKQAAGGCHQAEQHEGAGARARADIERAGAGVRGGRRVGLSADVDGGLGQDGVHVAVVLHGEEDVAPVGGVGRDGTSHAHLLVIPPGWPVTVVRIGPVGASRWISMGAPGAVSLPMMGTMPPGCTVGDEVVSDTGAMHAHARPTGRTTASAANDLIRCTARRSNHFSTAPFPRRAQTSQPTCGCTLPAKLE